MSIWYYCSIVSANGLIRQFSSCRMAQSKMNDLAGKFGKNGPPGLGIGLKLLAVGGALVYGISNSMYTGKFAICTKNVHVT